MDDAAATKTNGMGKAIGIGIWIALFILSFLVTYFEADVQARYSWGVPKLIGIGPLNHSNATQHLYTSITYTLITVIAFAFLNPYLITKLAGKYRRSFAQGFAVSSVLWIGLGVLPLVLFLPHSDKFDLMLVCAPGIALIIGGGLQMTNSLQVAKANLHQFKRISQLSDDDKKTFESAIHELKRAQNHGACNILATRCVQLLLITGSSVGIDDFHTLTKELTKQNRRQDAEEISNQYVALIEKTLPSS